MRYRKKPDTDVPTMFVHWCSPEDPLFTWLSRARMPKLSNSARPKTIEE